MSEMAGERDMKGLKWQIVDKKNGAHEWLISGNGMSDSFFSDRDADLVGM